MKRLHNLVAAGSVLVMSLLIAGCTLQDQLQELLGSQDWSSQDWSQWLQNLLNSLGAGG